MKPFTDSKKKPLIAINFKAYESSTGERALKLAKFADEVHDEYGVPVIIAVQAIDIAKISSTVDIPVFAEHAEPVGFGAHTGAVLLESVKAAGAKGTIINHSEHTLDLKIIEKTVQRAKELGLKTIVCAGTADQAKAVACFVPDFVAFEPPELIGGNVSVSSAQPDVIKDAVKKVKSISPTTEVLVGAGVKSKEDVDKAVFLGAVGVLLASHITEAKFQKEAIKGLIK